MSPVQPGLMYCDSILYAGNVQSSVPEDMSDWQERILTVEKDSEEDASPASGTSPATNSTKTSLKKASSSISVSTRTLSKDTKRQPVSVDASNNFTSPSKEQMNPTTTKGACAKNKACCSCSPEMEDAIQEMMNLALLKDPVFLVFAFSNFLTSVGFNVPYVYTVDRALETGIADADRASFLLSIVGAFSTVGRVLFCYLTDRTPLDGMLVYAVCVIACGGATMLSSVATSYYSMAIYCAVFGLTTGATVGLLSLILVDLLGMEKLTNAYGLVMLFIGVASFIGPPMAGWLYQVYGSYDPGFYASGASILVSGLVLAAVPCIKHRRVARDAAGKPKENSAA